MQAQHQASSWIHICNPSLRGIDTRGFLMARSVYRMQVQVQGELCLRGVRESMGTRHRYPPMHTPDNTHVQSCKKCYTRAWRDGSGLRTLVEAHSHLQLQLQESDALFWRLWTLHAQATQRCRETFIHTKQYNNF